MIKYSFFLFLSLIIQKPEIAGQARLTENQKIEYLIQSIQKLDGAMFFRNGTWHAPDEAAAHLRMKWENAGNRIKSARQFIDKIASTSSVSGNPYKIKFSDGKIVESKVFLNQQLAKLENKSI